MSYGKLIKSLLDPVMGGRVYPDTPPDITGTEPFLMYQAVGGVSSYYMENALPDKTNSRVQLNIWSSSKEGTYTAMVNTLRAVAGHPDMMPLSQPVDEYEPTVRLYGSSVDISVWSEY